VKSNNQKEFSFLRTFFFIDFFFVLGGERG